MRARTCVRVSQQAACLPESDSKVNRSKTPSMPLGYQEYKGVCRCRGNRLLREVSHASIRRNTVVLAPYPPPGLEDWFCKADAHGCPARGGRTRVDEYVRDIRQVELGLKRRDGHQGVEVKGLVAVTWGGGAGEPFAGPIELWTKWISEPLELLSHSTVPIEKQRWLRQFDTTGRVPQEIALDNEEKPHDRRLLPALGCNEN